MRRTWRNSLRNNSRAWAVPWCFTLLRTWSWCLWSAQKFIISIILCIKLSAFVSGLQIKVLFWFVFLAEICRRGRHVSDRRDLALRSRPRVVVRGERSHTASYFHVPLLKLQILLQIQFLGRWGFIFILFIVMMIIQLKWLMNSFTFLEEEESGCRCHTCTILIASCLLETADAAKCSCEPAALIGCHGNAYLWLARDILERKQETAFVFLSLSTLQNFPAKRLDNIK